jgi:hypothetical protein
MKTLKNTTVKKQENLIAFALESGVSLETVKNWYKDPIMASALNAMAEGLATV